MLSSSQCESKSGMTMARAARRLGPRIPSKLPRVTPACRFQVTSHCILQSPLGHRADYKTLCQWVVPPVTPGLMPRFVGQNRDSSPAFWTKPHSVSHVEAWVPYKPVRPHILRPSLLLSAHRGYLAAITTVNRTIHQKTERSHPYTHLFHGASLNENGS